MAVSFQQLHDWYQGSPSGKESIVRVGKLVVDTDPTGAEPDEIPASLFGFNRIVGVSNFVTNANDEPFAVVIAADLKSIMGVAVDTEEVETVLTSSLAAADLPVGVYTITITGV